MTIRTAINYLLDSGKVLRVGYAHEPLKLNQLYDAGHVIDRAIEVFTKPAVDADKWWQPHFSGPRGTSLPMQLIHSMYPAVSWPNEEREFSATADGDKIRISAAIDGTTVALEKYEQLVRRSEDLTETYWNDYFQLEAGQSSTENALDFIFGQLLSERAIIIDIDTGKLSTLTAQRVISVARRELPLGCIPIIRQY